MFSEKYGYKAEQKIQIETVSQTLRQRIWNLFYQEEIHEGGLSNERITRAMTGKQTVEEKVADRIGFDISDHSGSLQNKLKKYILETSWYNVLDFIEIHLSVIDEKSVPYRIKKYNQLLESEKSGYRIVNGSIAPITNPTEIEAIEKAANIEFESVNTHIQKALDHYSRPNNPDYENSVKESISAVEAICCIITGESGKQATLGKTIKKLKAHGIHIHSAMENAFSSLYGYTSDEDGMRHGSMDFTNAPAEDAKYMLVSCSAFVNYLIEKWSKVQAHEGGEQG